MKTLDGPRLAARSGRADSLVVLLHGYGANGQDLIELGNQWSAALPHTAFVAPNAPEPLDTGVLFESYQWFEITLRDPAEFQRGVRAAGPILQRFLDEELAAQGVDPRRLVLVGFSQGTMMALHVGLRRAVGPAALVGYSGALADGEHLASEATCRPPVLLIHGDDDEVVPVGAMQVARQALAGAGIEAEAHVMPGIGHGIDDRGLRLAGDFIAARLTTR